jgi:hypothetical protein
LRWALFLLLVAWPVFGGEIPEATRAHLKLLQDRLATMPAGKGRDKIAEEVARIRREYGLGAGVRASEPVRRKAEPAQGEPSRKGPNWQRAKDDFVSAAEEELKGRNEAWERRKSDFVSAAEGELKHRRHFSRFYTRREDWQRTYEAQLAFAQKPVRQGGLGYDFAEADRWVKKVLDLQPPEAIAAFRSRYAKAVAYTQLPKEQGGLGYVRAYARKVAVEVAEKGSDSYVENWIAQNRRRTSGEHGGFGRTCREWFRSFGG